MQVPRGTPSGDTAKVLSNKDIDSSVNGTGANLPTGRCVTRPLDFDTSQELQELLQMIETA